MGKLQETLQALLAHQEKTASGSRKKSESKELTTLSSPSVAEVGGYSSCCTVAITNVAAKGCSYKEFAACKPPTYEGECHLVLVMKWVKEMELVFATSKCVVGSERFNTSEVNTSEVNTSEVNTSEVNTSEVNTSEVNTSEVNAAS
ncbi:hypothetical protein L6452_09423 [Arctium lappa]|uniref:Uncharacterized protein n=1 Tax=Arctium lappa TaxID=4217 RepID=A0ACB9DL61_ARCLA|nr:hypothetical protein L6452_09423 [Arctium lappa]